MSTYVVTMSDGYRVKTGASSPEQAARQVCTFLLAPLSAVRSVRLGGTS